MSLPAHFIKVFKVYRSKKQSVDESDFYSSKFSQSLGTKKSCGNSFTFIDIPLCSEINSDLSNMFTILSKLQDKKLDMRSLDCLF